MNSPWPKKPIEFGSSVLLSPILCTLIFPPLDESPTQGLRSWLILPELEEILAGFHHWLKGELLRLFSFNICSTRDNLIFSEKAFKSGKTWTAASHMFVHASYAHLGNNLLSLAVSSREPWIRLGPTLFWSVFMLGGGASALNSPLKTLQTKKKLLNWIRAPPWLRAFVPYTWHSSIQSWRDRATGEITNALRPHIKLVGCSGGVSAVAGVNFGIVLETLLDCASGSGSAMSGIMAVADIVKIASVVSKETTILLSGANTNVDHSAHLTGFAFGMAFYGLFACHSKWRRKKKRRPLLKAWRK